MSEPYIVDRHEVRVTVSIGVSTYPDDGADADLLIKNAEVFAAALQQVEAIIVECCGVDGLAAQ